MSNEVSITKLLSELEERESPTEDIKLSQRIALILQGIPMLVGLAVSGAVYWLFMLWDFRGIKRRSVHFRLKLRNMWQSYFRPKYIKKWESLRFHECEHCGACCEILWKCPFLKKDESGRSFCSVHSNRPLPCKTFPVDYWSADMISKGRPANKSCSYIFLSQYYGNNGEQIKKVDK